MKIIFLDFDGVLNSVKWYKANQSKCEHTTHEEFHLDPSAIAILQSIVNTADANIVISSTWRRGKSVEELRDILAKRGLLTPERIIGTTPILDSKIDGSIFVKAVERGHEIQLWLDDNKELDVERFAILDDDADMVHLLPRLVKCDSAEGLTPSLAEQCIKLLK